MVKKVQLPVIGGVRKTIQLPSAGTTIEGLPSSVSIAQLKAVLGVQPPTPNTAGGNIGPPGGGASPATSSAKTFVFMDSDSGGGGDDGPPGQAGRAGATGSQGPMGPAIYLDADAGADGDSGPPGVAGMQGVQGVPGPTGPVGSSLVYSNSTVPAGNTVANTSAETFFASSYSIPGNSLALGTVVRLRLFGVYSTGVVAPSLILRVYFGSNVMIASGTLTTVANIANDGWSAEGLFIVQTTGVSGSIEAQGLSEFSTASAAVLFVNMDNTAPIAVDTTIAEIVKASVQWGGTVSASDTITLREMTVEVMTLTGSPTSGTTGSAVMLFMGDDGEEGMRGPPGKDGAQGLAGLAGLAVFLEADAGLDGDMGPPGVQGPPGAAGGGGTPGVPATINDLILWFKTDAIKATVGRPVIGLSNNCPWYTGVDVALPAPAISAVISATTLNSLPTMALVGNEHYSISTGVLLDKSTVFAVVNPSSLVSGAGFGVDITSGVSSSLEVRLDTTGHIVLVQTGIASIGTSTSAAVTVGSWSQFNSSYDSATGVFSFRAGQANIGSGTNALAISAVNTGILWFISGTNLDFLGAVAEIIIYNRVLTLAEIQSVEAYLHTKWGV